uniref:Uncharacterized protein n=1 Tax=Ixodes ricinus TaxID=34613 RepID=A0A6B0V1I7_IXORI
MSVPPSSLGGFQDTSQLSLVILSILISSGARGTSRTVTVILAVSVPLTLVAVRTRVPLSPRSALRTASLVLYGSCEMFQRLTSSMLLPSRVHFLFGGGSPRTGTSSSKFLPALTLMSCMALRSILGAMFLGRATCTPVDSLGDPGPPLLTARTRNSYGHPSTRSPTLAFVSSPGTSRTGVQSGLYLSFFSMT